MLFYETLLDGKFVPVTLEGKNPRERFTDWVLLDTPFVASPINGGMKEAQEKLAALDVIAYQKTRNHLDGAVSGLSPYIEHGLIQADEVLKFIDSNHARIEAYHFLQQLSWRAFFEQKYLEDPSLIWKDAGDYKTGFKADDYADKLPKDILNAKTPVAVINQFIAELYQTGYLHNHARLYLASYIVHWRKIKWQTGAKWMLSHLLDGNLASNNYSWQWVASTGSNKPYIFNLDNVTQFASKQYQTQRSLNLEIDKPYTLLKKQLFPNVKEFQNEKKH
ncbi:deoxyribodipyrimidine photo-lyase [Thiomicrorhabdus immobilis]|uniref:Deoxyribodipyrimidine photo-lyase n=1 Tax=Thiomicrorhabdus immobilis TaxID=2791037 RepID=A0ABM7MFR1_9GAMM|nr:FAD-binding domain-containing protein [Thiomicrorhabdus immobilis]BCN94337.1 deoxyribodipyrimidine photo-lyase [Thiomicrorhabdus immobilis]